MRGFLGLLSAGVHFSVLFCFLSVTLVLPARAEEPPEGAAPPEQNVAIQEPEAPSATADEAEVPPIADYGLNHRPLKHLAAANKGVVTETAEKTIDEGYFWPIMGLGAALTAVIYYYKTGRVNSRLDGQLEGLIDYNPAVLKLREKRLEMDTRFAEALNKVTRVERRAALSSLPGGLRGEVLTLLRNANMKSVESSVSALEDLVALTNELLELDRQEFKLLSTVVSEIEVNRKLVPGSLTRLLKNPLSALETAETIATASVDSRAMAAEMKMIELQIKKSYRGQLKGPPFNLGGKWLPHRPVFKRSLIFFDAGIWSSKVPSVASQVLRKGLRVTWVGLLTMSASFAVAAGYWAGAKSEKQKAEFLAADALKDSNQNQSVTQSLDLTLPAIDLLVAMVWQEFRERYPGELKADLSEFYENGSPAGQMLLKEVVDNVLFELARSKESPLETNGQFSMKFYQLFWLKILLTVQKSAPDGGLQNVPLRRNLMMEREGLAEPVATTLEELAFDMAAATPSALGRIKNLLVEDSNFKDYLMDIAGEQREEQLAAIEKVDAVIGARLRSYVAHREAMKALSQRSEIDPLAGDQPGGLADEK